MLMVSLLLVSTQQITTHFLSIQKTANKALKNNFHVEVRPLFLMNFTFPMILMVFLIMTWYLRCNFLKTFQQETLNIIFHVHQNASEA